MSTWEGRWAFNNCMHAKHGSNGTMTVSASTESKAREAVKEEASRRLFHTTMMQNYIEVHRLTEVPHS